MSRLRMLFGAVIAAAAIASVQVDGQQLSSNWTVSHLAGSPGVFGSTDGIGAAARFHYPTGIWGDATSLYVTDTVNDTVRQIDIASGNVFTLLGTPGVFGFFTRVGPEARLMGPAAVWGRGGTLYLSYTPGHVVYSATLSTLQTNSLVGFNASPGEFADGSGVIGRFNMPRGIWGDGANLYVADSANHAIRKVVINTTAVTTLAGALKDTSSGLLGPGLVTDSLAASGQRATFSSQRYADRFDIVVESASEVQLDMISTVFDCYLYLLNADRSAILAEDNNTGGGTAARIQTTLQPGRYIVEATSASNGVSGVYQLRTNVTGEPSAAAGFADGTGRNARFNVPSGVWGDGTNLYVTDSGNHVIRKVAIATGRVTTIAGLAGAPGVADGVGAQARFNWPDGIWGDGTDLYIVDSENHTIRRLDLETGRVTTIAGQAGVAGSADGAGASATFFQPTGIWGSGGTLFVTDSQNHSVRRLTAPAPQPISTADFSLPTRGAVSLRTVSQGADVRVGYARLQASTAAGPPAGLAIFGFRQNGTLVTEAGVPAAAPVLSGRVYAEIGGFVDTGIAIANPNSQIATVRFHFTNANGVNTSTRSFTVPANGQMAGFLSQSPFNSGAIEGTFSFTSDVPVGVIALRGLTNERNEFLITTLPVIETTQQGNETVYFPHFADGGGWTTQIVLLNPTDQTISGTLNFFGQGSATAAAQPATVTIAGQTASSFAYSIPARTARRFTTSGSGNTQSGSVRAVPTPNTSSPSGVLVFAFRASNVTVTEAGVAAGRASSAFRVYAEALGNFESGEIGALQTGVALSNTTATPAVVDVELTYLDGTTTGARGSLSVPGNGQTAMFLKQIPGFQNLSTPFQGVIRLTVRSGSIAAVGLRGRYNERGDFLITTTPPVTEESAAGSSVILPHLAHSGGYTTQFVAYGRTADQSGNGLFSFFDQAGQALGLILR